MLGGQCKYQRFIETGNGKREKGKEGEVKPVWASLVMEVSNKDARPQKGTTAMRESG